LDFMIPTLEEALALHVTGEGSYRAYADPDNEAGTGMFGGWTAAVLLKSVLCDPRADGEAAAINVNYIRRIPPRSELTVKCEPVDGGPSVTTWRADIFVENRETPSASAHVVLANKRDSDGFTERAPPEAPDPDTLPMIHPPASFGQRVDMRAWTVPVGQKTSHSALWVRERSGHPIDHVLLAYLSDAYPPRIFMRSSGFRPSSTLTLSAYFYASAAELAGIGDDFILSEATGTRAAASTIGSQLNMWSRSGALLATSEQLCWFK
jgi:acyl-CoA thioesterase